MITPKRSLRGFTAIFLLLFLLTALMPVFANAEEIPTATATISVEKKLSGNVPSAEDTFTFMLIPDKASNPMPEGTDSDKVFIRGEGTADFGKITYTEPDDYTYTIKEVAADTASSLYDKTVYRVLVFVTTDDAGNLTAKVCMNKDGTEGKSISAVFAGNYFHPTNPPEHPQTGETNNLYLWIAIAGASAVGLSVLLIYDRRKEKKLSQS